MESRDVIDDVTNRRAVALSCWVPVGHEPHKSLILSEILPTQTDTSTDNKCRTHRRRNSTVELSCVGGVYWIRN